MFHIQSQTILKAFIINKIIDKYNHLLNISIIEFENSKKFIKLILEDIKFMIVFYKFEVIAQRKFLKKKYLSYLIYS